MCIELSVCYVTKMFMPDERMIKFHLIEGKVGIEGREKKTFCRRSEA